MGFGGPMRVFVKFDGDASGLVREADRADKAVDRVPETAHRAEKGLHAMGTAAKVTAGLLAGGLALGAKAAWDELREGSQIAKQTDTVIKSTGGAAHVTAKQISDLAGSIQRKSGMDDEAVQSGENLLLTFTNIQNRVGEGNDIFTQATRVMADMSVALGQDTKSSAIQLGKALNDPIKGVTALQRVGVSFTQAQKDQIRALVESGHTMEAQKLILGELTKEFGGSAKAAGDTLPGKLAIARGELENLAGSILEAALPALAGIAGAITDAIPTIERWAGAFVDAVGPSIEHVVGIVQENWPQVQRIVGAVADVIRDTVFPIFGRLAAVVGDAMGKVMGVFHDNEPEIRRIWDNVKQIIGAAAEVFKTVLLPVIRFVLTEVLPRAIDIAIKALLGVSEAVSKFIGFFEQVKDKVTAAVGATRSFVVGAVDRIVAVYTGLRDRLSDTVDGIAAFFGPEGGFRRPFRQAADWVSGRADAIVGFWRAMPGKVGDAIAAGADAVRDAIIGIFKPLPGVIKKLLGISSPSKVFAEIGSNIVHGLIHGIKKEAPKLLDQARGLAGSVAGVLGEASAPPSIGGSTSAGANVMLGQKMAARYGWTGPEFSALLKLWYGESGWRAEAYNASSGAQGIPQLLPSAHPGPHPGFPSWPPLNPAAQIAWGLNYIKGAYGDPIHAYEAWLSRSPHWYAAGSIFHKPNVIGVAEAGPEAVIPLNNQGVSFLVNTIGRLLGPMRTMPPGDGGETARTKTARAIGHHVGANLQHDFAKLLAWGKEVLARLDTIIDQLRTIAAELAGGSGTGATDTESETPTPEGPRTTPVFSFPQDRGARPWVDLPAGPAATKLGHGAVVDTSGVFDKIGKVAAALTIPRTPDLPRLSPAASSGVTWAGDINVTVQTEGLAFGTADDFAKALAPALRDPIIAEIDRKSRENAGGVFKFPPTKSVLR